MQKLSNPEQLRLSRPRSGWGAGAVPFLAENELLSMSHSSLFPVHAAALIQSLREGNNGKPEVKLSHGCSKAPVQTLHHCPEWIPCSPQGYGGHLSRGPSPCCVLCIDSEGAELHTVSATHSNHCATEAPPFSLQ